MTARSIKTKRDEGTSIYDVFRHESQEGRDPINLTVGNPNLKPPECYYTAMHEVVQDVENMSWNGHGYVVDEDPFGLCQRIADYLGEQFGVPFLGRDVAMTVGATGALDVILKTLLDPRGPCAEQDDQDEVIVNAPYFVEYLNLVRGNGGTPVVVHTNANYTLDIAALSDAITTRTKAIILNSPNNPTGTIYDESDLINLTNLLKVKKQELGQTIYVIEDAVYDTIHFKSGLVPSIIPFYDAVFRVNSYSKSMSLSGERIGYYATHPHIVSEQRLPILRSALHLNMRMRVVHAPLFQHRILARLPVDCATDITYYQRNVDCLYQCLTELGFGVQQPQGTFYLWAELPAYFESEMHFRELALDGSEPLLYLPGFLFGGEQYDHCVRFSACVSYETIEKACVKLRQIQALWREKHA